MLRLGIVNVEHKYFGQLYKNDKVEFNKIIQKLVPSRQILSSTHVAEVAYSLGTNKYMTSGTIIDISGGHSWIPATL